jgi:Cytosine/adenosine deaminases
MGKALKTALNDKDRELLSLCVKVAHEAMENGNHPFGALLSDAKGNVLMTQGNEFRSGGSAAHAETLLCLKAAKQYSPEFLSACTLYTNFEPCVMCTGAIYWSNIGRLCYGVSEKTLLKMTGDNEENPTFSLSAEQVIKAGQKTIVVAGPLDENDRLSAEIIHDHLEFWK